MRKYMTAFQMTQSMFCSLPFPCKNWDEKCRKWMLLFLPVVGLEIGVLWLVMDYVLRIFEVSNFIYGVAMCALPYLLTGFMHLDGYMDVIDSVCSWRPLERRREILKDSHVGSFAVVWCIFLILTEFAMFASVPEDAGRGVLLLVPALSRCCSALAIMSLKPMNTSQYVDGEYSKVQKWIVWVMLLLFTGCSFLLWEKYGVVLLITIVGYGAALRRGYRSLEGMNGDISGFCICISELCAAAALALL